MPSSSPEPPDSAAAPEFRMPPLEGYTGTPEEVERRWYQEAYLPRGAKMRQLSFRALFLGCFLGGIMAIPNIFMGLKSGVTMGLSLTCTLMGFMLWNTMLKLRLVKGRLTVLEYNAMASAASSASFTTVGGLVSAVAAFMLINHRTVPLHWLFLWTLGIALLGVTLAIPLKRRIINIEQLPFPGSIAGAETLQLLCAAGGKGERTGLALVWGGIFSAFYGLWDGLSELSEACGRWGYQRTVEWMDKLYGWSPAQASAYGSRQLFGEHLAARGVGLNFDLLFMVSGCFMGLRTTVVMFLAACACWLGWVPMLEGWNLLLKMPPGGHPGYAYLLSYTVWFGASCLVVAGIM